MNANMKTISSTFKGSDEDWIDEDDAPDLTDDYWKNAPVTFQRGNRVIARANGLTELHEKLREIESQKQTVKVIHFKRRTQQNRVQFAQMRQLMSKQQQAA